MHTCNEIKNGDKAIQAAEEEQIKFKSELGEITSTNSKHKSENQSGARQKTIDLFNDNEKTRSEAIRKTKQDGTGLKILTPKQML